MVHHLNKIAFVLLSVLDPHWNTRNKLATLLKSYRSITTTKLLSKSKHIIDLASLIKLKN